MEKKQSRKDFLTNSSKLAVGAMVGVAGVNMLSNGKIMAKSSSSAWPYPYAQLDPEEARIHAHTLYYSGKDCCSGVFGGLVECLKTAVGDPWNDFPIEIMLFGRGGGVGWGSICGALNGAAALISLVTDKAPSGALINEVWGWSTTENLPTDAANAATYTIQNYTGTLPQNISGSPLCHSSVSQWCMIANKKVSDIERKERCARLAGDLAAKTAEVLNAHFASTFVGTFTDPESNAVCMSCHGGAAAFNVMTHMECASCHTNEPVHGGIYTSVAPLTTPMPKKYSLENAYPNPFNPSTKIKFSIPKEEKVRLEIYDMRGRLVNSLIDSDMMSAGTYEATWNGTNNLGEKVASGVYLARMTTGNIMKTTKMNLVK
ncbi:MAG: T9SS type A sorting domain-containing protein [Ignavibacteriae bacterium]|nr:T9SS C-terminal target domain-containing protein [Ignavibacteriota bacterium]NOG99910.1 T9SS type A sorting domain-containing protein [Ignavibacteriota bacterium]